MINLVLYRIPAVILAVVIHEYIKAAASTKLYDLKPKNAGRLTLNPLVHMDVLGTIFMLIWGFGWGKPVETSPLYYTNQKNGTLIVYILPSAVNMVIGLIAAFCLFFLNRSELFSNPQDISAVLTAASGILKQTAYINIAMALFNIIPIYPLDGAKVLSVVMRPDNVVKMYRYEKIFQLILVFAIVTGFVGMLINPVINAILAPIRFVK